MPEGRRFGADPLEGKSPAWPDPDPDCMEYLAGRKVMTLGTDSTSMGPLPDLAEPTHFAGLKHGMIWTESATGLRPAPGHRRVLLHARPQVRRRHLQRAAGLRRRRRPARPPADRLGPQEERRRPLGRARRRPARLLARAGAWATIASPSSRSDAASTPTRGRPSRCTCSTATPGTHLVPPAYALPPEGFDDATYAPEVQAWLAEYEEKYGRRGTSDVTTEKVPALPDLRPGAGHRREASRSARPTSKSWPASPEITVDDIRSDESAARRAAPGRRRHLPQRLERPHSAGRSRRARPAWKTRSTARAKAGRRRAPTRSSTWRRRGIRCVATDAPTLGGVEPKRRPDDLLGTRQPGDGRRRVPDERRPRCRKGRISCSPR